jgi:hypothetical protein
MAIFSVVLIDRVADALFAMTLETILPTGAWMP